VHTGKKEPTAKARADERLRKIPKEDAPHEPDARKRAGDDTGTPWDALHSEEISQP